MKTEYHAKAELVLKNFGNKLLKEGLISKAETSRYPLLIKSPKNPKTYNILYKPDMRFTFHNKQQLIFEILSTQIEAKTIADIIRCVYSDSVTDLIFIVCSEYKNKKVFNVSTVIIDCIKHAPNSSTIETQNNRVPLVIHVETFSFEDLANENKIFEKIFTYIEIEILKRTLQSNLPSQLAIIR
jgi:hypothetical protein